MESRYDANSSPLISEKSFGVGHVRSRR